MSIICLDFAVDVPEGLKAFCNTEIVLKDCVERNGATIRIGKNLGKWAASRTKQHNSDSRFMYEVYSADGTAKPRIMIGRVLAGTPTHGVLEHDMTQPEVPIPEWFANIGDGNGWGLYWDETQF